MSSVSKVAARSTARAQAAAPDPMVEYDLERLDNHEGAKLAAPTAPDIDWESPGSFDDCVGVMGDKVDDPAAFCAQAHYDATGKWPSEKPEE